MTALRTNLFLVALGLSLLGLVMIYSATYLEFGTHYLFLRSGHILLGLLASWVASRVRYTAFRRLSPFIYFAVLASLVLVLIPGIGTEVGGSRRWFDLGVISLQPAEFAKVAAVIVLSCAIARYRPGASLPVGPLLGAGLLFLMILLEPDFGTSVVLLAGVAGVLWASEVRTRDLMLSSGVVLVAIMGAMWIEPYRRQRFLTFLDPWSASEGSGYQTVQSLIAIESGNVFGTGAGAGGQSMSIPEVQTDMIFALIGEELGLVGMLAVIGAFIFIALAGFRIALQAPSVMARCIAAGLATMLAVQAIFNMGATMNILPLAGMTLPFVSYGGSSLIVSFISVGVLYRISEDSERAREARPRNVSKRNTDLDSRRRDRRARNPRAVRG